MSSPSDHTTEARTHAPLRGALFGLAAATLFGLSAPVAKLLLASISPVLLAGLLYLGATLGLAFARALVPRGGEAQLTRRDAPKLALVVLCGGVIAPVLMLLGLRRVTAVTGSLLLNLEAPLTVLLAVALFREHLGRHAATAVALILVGGAILKFEPGSIGADTMGVLLLTAACGCWAIDNNLTQRLSLKDPFAIVRVKALVAGLTNTTLSLLVLRDPWPPLRHVALALILGSLSYGVSIVLDTYALRLVGAAREAAYFATAPFVGALLSLLVLRESPRPHAIVAMMLMAVGVWYMLREKHDHRHAHDPIEHEHSHWHDEHHHHEHADAVEVPSDGPHSHWHRHAPIEHEHEHVPDAHHRHEH